MRVWLVAVLLSALALAGCIGEDSGTDSETPDEDTDEGNDVDAGNSTAGAAGNDTDANETGAPAASNTAPEITQFEANTTSGEAPFTVTFTLDAVDDDGDGLNWILDVDGDGTADSEGALLPFNFTYTFTTVGTFNATLNVTDGTDFAASMLTVTVTEPAEAGSEGTEETGSAFPLVLEGAVELDCATTCEPCIPTPLGGLCVIMLGEYGCIGYQTGEQGIDCRWYEVPEEAVGHKFLLESTAGDPDLAFGPCATPDSDPETAADFMVFFTELYANAGPETGVVPAGYDCVIVWEWNPAPSTLTLTIS